MRISGTFKDVTDTHSYSVTIENAHGSESYTVAGSVAGSAESNSPDAANLAADADVEASTETTTGATSVAESGAGHVWFGENPVTVETKNDGVETVIIEGKASVDIVTDSVLTGLFSNDVTDTHVSITCDGNLFFEGYMEPRAYSQPVSDETNALTLNCIDGLTATKYRKFRNVGSTVDYERACGEAGMTSISSLLAECIGSVCSVPIWYDGSKVPSSGSGNLLDVLQVNSGLYLGDGCDSVKTCYEVVEDLLRYLGLHALETCGGVYIFSLGSLGKDITWTALVSSDVTSAGAGGIWQWRGGLLSDAHLGGADGSVDIGEVYNQVALTVHPTSSKSSDSVLHSLLDSSGTVPSMGGRVTYVTEYAADGNGKKAARAFWNLIKNHSDDGYDSQTWKDYLVRPMRNIYWTIGNGSGPGSAAVSWTSTSAEGLVDRLGSELGALLVSSGSVDHKPGSGDTSKQATVSMTTQLVVSVNGNGDDSNPSPTDTDIQGRMPLASYVGGDSTAVYSPSDPTVKTYLVFSGTLVLLPLLGSKFTVENVRHYSDGDSFYSNYPKDYGGVTLPGVNAGLLTSPSRENGDGRYLAFEWWQNGQGAGTRQGWLPDTGDGPEEYEYKTSDGKDTKDKVDVLWCMLRIGDQVVVEDKNKQGEVGAFTWQPYKSLSDCGGDVDRYLEQTFTIGIDPKIGDKIIGQEYSIGTNFDYTMNIDADGGMAIPLPYSSALHGTLRLDILGIDNGPWENYHKTRHATMFRHSTWGTDVVPLMSHVSSVLVKNFNVKFYTDTEDTGEDSDIVYVSRASKGYVNKKEVSGSLVTSGFTSSEMSQYHLSNTIVQSTVCDGEGRAVLTVKDTLTNETGKPEKLYVDELWRRLHTARLTLSQTVRPALVSPWGGYVVPSLGKTMTVVETKANLAEGTCKVKLAEI